MNESAQTPSSEPLSPISRMIGIITSPRATFEDIVQRPTWLLPFLLLIIASVATAYLILDLVVAAQVEQMSKNPQITQEQIEVITGGTEKYWWVVALISPIIMYILIPAVVLLFTGNVILGGESKFKTVFAVTCWSHITSVLASIIFVPLVRLKGALESPTSLAFLSPSDDKTSFLYVLFSSLDLLRIWPVVVLGIGIAAAYKFTNQKGITVTVVLWLIYILGSAGLTAAFN